MTPSTTELENKLDYILDFHSIKLDRDEIKKDIIELIEDEKQKAYERGMDSIRLSPDYSGTIGGSSLND